jgi:hypothetical protein
MNRRELLLAHIEMRGGITQAAAEDWYRTQDWQPGDAVRDLYALRQVGDVTLSAAGTWAVNSERPAWLGGVS